jgi:hypothetical protein
MANPCINFDMPLVDCTPPGSGGVRALWITESENVENVVVSPITGGVIDAETEGNVTAITMATTTRFIPIIATSGTINVQQALADDGTFTQTITFQFSGVKQLNREIVKKFKECSCGLSVIVFHNADMNRPELIHGTVEDAFGNLINNSPLRLTTATFDTGTASADINSATIVFTRQNGSIEQLGRFMNMAAVDIKALTSPAP